ncbi:MAG: hypothetical protein KKF98_05580 [Bacteroidetes bacterium]|jgi:hypothetical protein|nr:hypothetical protein [Bacteroidota bacterium]
MEDERFKHDLDELFRLFKRMVEEQSMDDIPGVDKQMLRQFQFFFDNYENMKDQISSQLQGQFGAPVKEMVRNLLKQMREQLGEEEYLSKVDNDTAISIDMSTREVDIKAIDEMLKNPNLTEEQINELLDKRAGLI